MGEMSKQSKELACILDAKEAVPAIKIQHMSFSPLTTKNITWRAEHLERVLMISGLSSLDWPESDRLDSLYITQSMCTG